MATMGRKLALTTVALTSAAPALVRRKLCGERGAASLRVRFVYVDTGVSTRYRVYYQIEQARLAGLAVEDMPLDSARVYDLATCDLVYVCRLELSVRTWPLVAAARALGVPVVFDTDDLVWDDCERAYNYLDAHFNAAEVATLMQRTRRLRAMMQRADALVLSTPYLAGLARQRFAQPTHVNANTVSQAMLDRSAAAYAERQQRPPRDEVVISYFSGTPHVHDEDIGSIAPALCATLRRFPQTRLRFYGNVGLQGELASPAYAAQIGNLSGVDWRTVPQHIAATDINIAPLVDNPQRRAKSGIKYLEAALVGVPTVAANLEPYQMVIDHGRTGFLASTCAEWVACLAQLIVSTQLRRDMGAAARVHTLAEYTPAARAANFAAILREVCTNYEATKKRR